MKILHAPHNIGGMAGTMASAQAKLGHKAHSYAFVDNQFKFPATFRLPHKSRLNMFKYAMKFAFSYDIFHFYYGASLLGSSLADVPWLHRSGKKIFFHFCGCDCRDEKTVTFKYPLSACKLCWPKLCLPNIKDILKVAAKYGHVNFVSTPDLLEFVERSVLMPQSVNFDLIDSILMEPIENIKLTGKFTIVHAPTDRRIKGTEYVVKSIDNLKKKGLNIELKLIENMTHEETMRLCLNSDLAVDQLFVGSYGLFAAETMALGVPTVCYLRDDLIGKYDEEPPLINARYDNIEDVIHWAYKNQDEIKRIGKSGFDYARKYHHPSQIAMTCLEYYKNGTNR